MAFFLFIMIHAMIHKSVNFRVLILFTLLLMLATAACGPAPEAEQPPTVTAQGPEQQDGYPAPTAGEEESYPPPPPTAAVNDGPYPPPTAPPPTAMLSYPEPEIMNTPEGAILFAFERPVAAGDTTIRGVGPAGLAIQILNVTFMGQEMASTTIGDDGRFEVSVPPLEPGVRVGLSADLEGTELGQRIWPGEGALGLPQVGYFFDTVVIVAEQADS